MPPTFPATEVVVPKNYKFKVEKRQTNLEIAIRLAEAGVKVFPCYGAAVIDAKGKSKEKSPYGKWQDAPTGDVEWVKAQWADHPTAIPGMSLEAQNIIVFDLDTDEGRRQWDQLCKNHPGNDLGGPRTYTPNGTHIFYYLGPDVKHGNALGSLLPKTQGGKIDVRGPGAGYVIAPGAQKVDGEIYASSDSDPLTFLDCPEIPPWLLEVIQTRLSQPAPPPPVAPVKAAPSTTHMERRISAWAEKAFEAEIRLVSDCPEGGRNDQLNKSSHALFQIVAGGFLDAGTVYRALVQAAHDNGSVQDDGEKAVKATIQSGQRAGMSQPRKAPEGEDDNDDHFENLARAGVKFSANGRAYNEDTGEIIETEYAQVERESFPLHLTKVPGLLGWIVDWIEASARVPSREMALGAAIGVVGTAMGRHWCGPTNAAQGTYIVVTAPTGAGKDHILNAVQQLMIGAGMTSRLGAPEFMSQSSVVKLVKDKPCCVCPMDEFGAFLKRINNTKASGFEAAITKTLREVWSRNLNPLLTPAWASQASEVVHGCQVSIVGVTTPFEFFAAINGSSDISNGLLNRMMLINLAKRGSSQEPTADPFNPPHAILAAMRGLWSGGSTDLQVNSNNYTEAPQVHKIPWHNDEVRLAWSVFEEEIQKRRDTHPDQDPFLARVCEMAIRLATIRAGGQNCLKPSVTMEDFRWGQQVSLWSAEEMIKSVKDYVADTDSQRNAQRIMRIVSERGGAIKRRDLARALAHRLSNQEFAAVLANLGESETLVPMKLPNADGGTKKVNWLFVPSRIPAISRVD